MKLKAVSGTMLALLFIGMLTLAFNIQQVNAGMGDVVLEFPCPPVAEEEGLAFGQGYLWFASQTQGIYQLDPSDGSIVSWIPMPSECIEIHGLAHDGNYVWAAAIDNNLYQLDPWDGSVTTWIPAPGGGHVEGLGWDGAYLWLSRGDNTIYKVDPSTGNAIDSFPTGSSIPEGLAYGGGFLWEGGDDAIIYKIDPETGLIITSFSAPGSDVHGLAWDGAYLWSDSVLTEMIYKIEIAPPVGTNLLRNPDFEQQLDYWSTSMGTATYTADPSNPLGGSYSAKGVELNEGSLGRLYQDMTGIVHAGGEYQISGWIRTQDVVGWVVIALDYVDSNGWTPADGYVKEIGYVTGSTDWTYFESDVFTLPPMPSNATAIWFLFDFNNGKGTAWWDDVSLIEIPLVLIDEGHSEWLVSNNAHFLIQNLEERGYLVQTLTGTITPSSLEDCDVLIIGTAWGSFTHSEIQAIEDFVKNGGGLWLTGLGWSWVNFHPGTTLEDYPMNKIAQRFGAFFNPDIIYDPTDYTSEPASAIFHSPFIESHPVTQGVTRIGATGAFHGSISIQTGTILITGDDDSYGGYHESPYPNPGSHPPNCAAIEYGSGKVIVISQEGFFIDDHIDEYDNKILGVKIINWLSQPPPPEVWVDDDADPEWYADPTHFATIQEGVEAVAVGGSVFVFNGTYYEHVTIDKSLTLIGENPSTTIIDGQGVGNTILVAADGAVIEGFTVTNCGSVYPNSGIFLDNVVGSTVQNNNVSKNLGHGIFVMWGDDNLILNNLITHNVEPGIRIDVSRNKVLNNTIEYSLDGILLYGASDCVIEDNKLSNHKHCGISMQGGSRNTTIRYNTMTNNVWDGIFFYVSSNNRIYHNNFINNTEQVFSYDSINTWDDGYPSGGNYWSDYTGVDVKSGPNQDQPSSDGLGDITYVINGNNQDNYPLMGPFTSFSVIWEEATYYIDTVSNSILSDFYFSQPDKLICFNVTGPDATVGFCRVTIPKSLLKPELSETWKIIIDDAPPLSQNIIEDENSTYLYFTYEHSIHRVEIRVITEKVLLGTGWGVMRIEPRKYVWGRAELYEIRETQIELVIVYESLKYSGTWNIFRKYWQVDMQTYLCYSEEWGYAVVRISDWMWWRSWSLSGREVWAFGFASLIQDYCGIKQGISLQTQKGTTNLSISPSFSIFL